MAFSFFESAACAEFAGCDHTRRHARARGGRDEPGCRGHRRRVGDGAGGRPAPRGGGQPGRAARPRRRRRRRRPPRSCADRASRAIGVAGRRHRPGRGRRRASAKVRSELGPIEIIGDERRVRRVPAVHRNHARGVGTHARGQPHRHVPLRAGRDPRHARGGLGPHRDDLVVERAVGRGAHGALRRVEGRRRRAHEGVGRRVRAATASP